VEGDVVLDYIRPRDTEEDQVVNKDGGEGVQDCTLGYRKEGFGKLLADKLGSEKGQKRGKW